MFRKIYLSLNNEIAKNFFYFSVIKFANILSKYILLGYLIRTLGEEGYGVLTWVDSFVQYFLILVNFGFDMYAAKYIVENKQNKTKIDEIISAIITVKTGLFVFGFVLLGLFSFNNEIAKHIDLIFFMLFMGIGEILFPIWYFQGIEKMKPIAIVSVVSRTLLVFLTILFVKNSSHIAVYIFILVLSNIVWGGLGFYFLKKKSDFKFILVPLETIKHYLKEGYLFFLGRFSTLFLNFGTIFLIGYFCSKNLVSGFDIASKIIFAFIFPFEVIQQAVFPLIVRTKNKLFLQRLVLFTICSALFFSGSIYYFSEEMMTFFGGNQMTKYAYLLESLVVLIPVISCSIIIGSCSLVAFGALKQYNYALVFSCLIYFFTVLLLYVMNQMSFINLLLLRISVDVIMVMLIFYFAVKKKTLL
ncbi:oligosaccharide flippase family protein [Flavobacterium xueshanense]|uniref:Polysaccharide transporter, PST family n=1 Tax=Flavobacterium xueshanense TaxID=935223 RepID=A0A1I2BBD7_9FLAO|nr:oligosaccharide flippase family protein [Flavobacterium xueshanense]SFE53471.1 polysaccharide transporter, PST family [Flavobacterium xueshanense]